MSKMMNISVTENTQALGISASAPAAEAKDSKEPQRVATLRAALAAKKARVATLRAALAKKKTGIAQLQEQAAATSARTNRFSWDLPASLEDDLHDGHHEGGSRKHHGHSHGGGHSLGQVDKAKDGDQYSREGGSHDHSDHGHGSHGGDHRHEVKHDDHHDGGGVSHDHSDHGHPRGSGHANKSKHGGHHEDSARDHHHRHTHDGGGHSHGHGEKPKHDDHHSREGDSHDDHHDHTHSHGSGLHVEAKLNGNSSKSETSVRIAGGSENTHRHGPGCGHVAMRHEGHIGYLVDGFLECHLRTLTGEALYAKHAVPPGLLFMSEQEVNALGSSPSSCGHIRVQHSSHYDCLVGNELRTSCDSSIEHSSCGFLPVLSDIETERMESLLSPLKGGTALTRRYTASSGSEQVTSHHSSDGKNRRDPVQESCCTLMRMNKDSWRFIVMFILTGGFFFMELIVGILAQSISLQADAMHMLSDVMALAIGFAAALMAQKSHTSSHTFGFVRMEVIGALINSTYLLATCMGIIFEAIERFREIEHVCDTLSQNVDLVMIVGIVGLLINIVGLFIFCGAATHGHSHAVGGDHGHSHGGGAKDTGVLAKNPEGDHGHAHGDDHDSHGHDSHGHGSHGHDSHGHNSHGHDNHGHAHDEHACDEHDSDDHDSDDHDSDGHNSHGHGSHGHGSHTDHHDKPAPQCCDCLSKGGNLNIMGVLLHVAGDALGSVVVIIATLVIKFGPQNEPLRCLTDPIGSLIIVVIILVGAFPLFVKCISILLHTTPKYVDADKIISDVKKQSGVLDVHEFHCWQLNNSKTVGSMHVVVYEGCSWSEICDKIKLILHEGGVHSSAIQPEFVPRDCDVLGSEGKDLCNEFVCDTECIGQQCC